MPLGGDGDKAVASADARYGAAASPDLRAVGWSVEWATVCREVWSARYAVLTSDDASDTADGPVSDHNHA